MSSSKTRILLDTTYILPVLGVRVKGIEDVIAKLRTLYLKGEVELYYSPYSLFEALGKISETSFDDRVVEEGLLSITESGTFIEAIPTTEGYLKALKLKSEGFGDLIDLILYSTALTKGLRFLTRDKKLIKFIEDSGEDVTVFLSEEELP